MRMYEQKSILQRAYDIGKYAAAGVVLALSGCSEKAPSNEYVELGYKLQEVEKRCEKAEIEIAKVEKDIKDMEKAFNNANKTFDEASKIEKDIDKLFDEAYESEK